MSNNFTELFQDTAALTQAQLESAYKTLTLDIANTTQMTSGSTTGQALVSTGSGTAAAFSFVDSPWATVENLGLSASISANALTLTLTARDGTTLSGSNRGRVAFRDSTLTNGRYTTIALSSGISLTLPAGATLQKSDNTAGYIYVYAQNFGGAVELAVAGAPIGQESILNSTTAISSSSTNNNVLYSLNSRASIPVRFIGRLKVSNTTAGQYASLPSEITMWPLADNLITPVETFVGNTTNASAQTTAAGTYKIIDGWCNFQLTTTTIYTTGTFNSSTLQVWLPVNSINATSAPFDVLGTMVSYSVSTPTWTQGQILSSANTIKVQYFIPTISTTRAISEKDIGPGIAGTTKTVAAGRYPIF